MKLLNPTIAVFNNPSQPISIKEIVFPILQPGELLVKVKCATICGSDIHTLRGIRKELVPTVLGHEIVGEVIEINSELPLLDLYGKEILIGDRITWTIYASCGHCDMCVNKIPQKCINLFKYGHQCISNPDHLLSGGYASHVKIEKGTGIIKIENDIPDRLICPVNCSTATISAVFGRVPLVERKTVLVIGGGMLGIMACAMASVAGGAKSVLVVEKHPSRAELSYNFGAEKAYLISDGHEKITKEIKAVTNGKMADIIIETSGRKEAVEFAVKNLAIGGNLMLVGSAYPQPNISVSAEFLLRRLATIHGIHNYNSDDLKCAYEFMTEHYKNLPFEKCFYPQNFTLNQINEAFDVAINKKPLRVAIQNE